MFSRLGIDALWSFLCFTISYIGTAFVCDYVSPRKCLKWEKVKKVLFRNFSAIFVFALVVPQILDRTSIPSCLNQVVFCGLEVVTQWIISLIVLDVWFYYAHRLMHYPPLYRLFHKQHHEFIKPYSWTGLYCSIAELFLVNLFSVTIGPLIVGMTGWNLVAWIVTISVLTVLSHHSGFNVPFFSDGKHDIHHLQFNYNYGIFEILDRLHGTFRAVEETPKKRKDTLNA